LRTPAYKVEKWTGDGLRVVDLLYAGSSVDRAHAIFATMVRHWPSIRLTIRQRTRVLQEWRRGDPRGHKRCSDAGKILLGGCRNQPCPFD